jgi:hypothetical protein
LLPERSSAEDRAYLGCWSGAYDVVSYALTDSFDRAIADTFRSGNQRLSDDPTLRTMLMQFTDEQNPSDGEDLASGMALKELGWA